MAGLLNASEQNPQQAAAPAAAGAEPAPNVSKEEQAQYDEFVTNAMSMMNSEKGSKALLKSIEGENPVEGLANAVASIVMRLEDSAEKAGAKISGDVMMAGGAEILEQAADLSEQAGGHAFTEEELEQAVYMAMDLYREARTQQGKLDQGSFGQDLNDLKAAEADGTLEEQIPGITEHSQKAGQTQPVEDVAVPVEK